MDESIMLSIAVLTYNHESYLRQALDSILEQKVNFKYEILVGDDQSSDHTRDIICEYKKKYPDRFRIFLRKKNVGATYNGYYLGTQSKGKYFTILEGDDYWQDDMKLQKQIDFLEHHPDFYACTHQCLVVDENNIPIESKNDRKESYFWYFSKKEYMISDFEKGRYAGHISTMVMRNIYHDPNLDCRICYKAHRMIGDRTIQLLVASQGRVYVMPEILSCYRLVENMNSKNWQAVARQKNKRYEEFAYICYLERYAGKCMHLDIDLSYVKKDKLICASIVLLNNWNYENLKVVVSMILVSGMPLTLFGLSIRAMLQKLYYWKIKKEDRPISF